MKRCLLSLAVISVIISVVIGHNQDGPQYKPCQLSESVNGTCLPVDDCPAAWRLLRMKLIEELRKQSCGFLGIQPLVCCQNETLNNNDQIKFQDKATSYTTLAPTRLETANTTSSPTIPPINISIKNPIIDDEQGDLNDLLQSSHPINNNGTSFIIPELANHQVTMAPEVTKLVLPDRRSCGRNADVTVRITGGVPTEITEFPWVARIKYKTANGTEQYGCSGTLINENYVLTAAHCVSKLAVTEVRLGEWDEETDIDCSQNKCNEKPKDFKVLSVIVHPKYDRRNLSHDIALIRLAHQVNYTDFVRPICLPTSEYVAKQDYIPDEMSYVTAGWGKTEFGPKSTILRKVNLKAVNMQICLTSHTQINEQDIDNLICAGGRKGEDSCNGDSGGGLFKQVKEDANVNCFLYGITSYGSKKCGEEAIPSVYTRVTAYMEWILSNIRP